ncbi:MAG: ParB/RepB/Spo0J family partition protein [Rhodovarius sp.]|nr:ParB/RepB/Spo0J family partition protein [Rhodovarius sp.]MCX7933238.1 ParB/RepB/Spo0J family partition protein [Rhodovarius sp.]MDW8314427.1 ParB/RepB/Spo0J family partition protein [Rhodovarius sp.]
MSKPPRLGRGLSALLGEVAAPRGEEPLRRLPIDLLEPGPFQARAGMDPEALEELAASIRRHGLLQPILVRPKPGEAGRFQIIGGERRWRAAQIAQLHEVPVIVRDFTDTEAMAAGLVENLQREDLNPLEEAEGYDRLLVHYGLTQQELAEAVGKSRTHITNMLRLLVLPERVRELVRQGALSAGHARALANAPDPVAAAQQVVDRGLSVRQTEALAKAKPTPAPPPLPRPGGPGSAEAAEVAALERDLERKLGLKVKIRLDRGSGSGQVSITYRSLDQFEQIIGLLTGRQP